MTREEAIRAEAAWIRTRAAVIKIKREALAGAGAKGNSNPGNCFPENMFQPWNTF